MRHAFWLVSPRLTTSERFWKGSRRGLRRPSQHRPWSYIRVTQESTLPSDLSLSPCHPSKRGQSTTPTIPFSRPPPAPPYLIHHAPAKSTNQKLAAFQKKPALLPRSAFHPNAVLGSGTAVYLLPGIKDQYNTDLLGQLTSTGFELMTMNLGLGPGEKARRSSRWNREKGLPSTGSWCRCALFFGGAGVRAG